jgi:hypothetical protein
MATLWKGEARPLPVNAFPRAARQIGCDTAALRAVWQVESGGRYYLKDGSVIRRFEPHKMPGSKLTWRDSLKIGSARREAMFQQAYRNSPEAACRATSWAAHQVMGFNHEDAGYRSARVMVQAFADSEEAQLRSFVNLVENWRLASALRTHDWLTFARRYNGTGQPHVYARKMENAYRRFSGGKASPLVLRIGARGAPVRRLQEALGIKIDGAFGRETEAAVKAFQTNAGLVADGIAGAKTWAALEAMREATPVAQPTCLLFPLIKGLLQ